MAASELEAEQRAVAEAAQTAEETARIEADEQRTAAEIARDAAQQQAHINLANQLVAQSTLHADDNNNLALLLGLEAVTRQDKPESQGALMSALHQSPGYVRFLTEHDSYVVDIAINPAGTVLVTAPQRTNKIRVWDIATGQLLSSLVLGDMIITEDLTFSPDGEIIVAAGCYLNATFECVKNVVHVWDMTEDAFGQLIGDPIVGDLAINDALAFSPDGRVLAISSSSASYDSYSPDKQDYVHLWDVEAMLQYAGAGIETLDTRYALPNFVDIERLTYSPDGKTLAVGGCATYSETGNCAPGQGLLELWEVNVLELAVTEPLRVATDYDYVQRLAFSPDGTQLAFTSYDVDEEYATLYVWDVINRDMRYGPIDQDEVLSIAFSPDGQTLASGGSDIYMRDAASGEALGSPLSGHVGTVYDVAFTPDGRTLASGSWDQTAGLWDLSTRGGLGTRLVRHNTPLTRLALSPNGEILAASGPGTINLWNSQTGELIGAPLAGHTGMTVWDVSFSPDGTLASSGMDDKIQLWDVATGAPLAPAVSDLTLDSDSQSGIFNVEFSPDGTLLAATLDYGPVRLWDVASMLAGQPVSRTLLGHTRAAIDLAFSPDGQTLASVSWDRTGRLWDVATGEPLGEPLTGHTHQVISVAFSPDGKTVATGSQDTTARLWDVATQQPIGLPLTGHEGIVWAVAFSPDGKTLATSSKTLIHLWDVTSDQPIGQPLSGHGPGLWGISGIVWGLAFSQDGKTLYSCSMDGTIRQWDVDPTSWHTRACAIVGRNLTQTECEKFLPGEPYRQTCKQWPAGE